MTFSDIVANRIYEFKIYEQPSVRNRIIDKNLGNKILNLLPLSHKMGIKFKYVMTHILSTQLLNGMSYIGTRCVVL